MKASLITVALVACSQGESTGRRPDPPKEASVPADARVLARTMTCEDAKQAIETRRFVGWSGLPAGCTPDAMFGVPFEEEEWPTRMLGKRSTRWVQVEVAGYYSPTVSVRDGVVVLFDGMNPDLDGGWAPLAADLGEPEAKLDWYRDTLLMTGGEWVYPARGITIFGRAAGNAALHVAVYTPTTLAEYEASLRPDLGTTLEH